MFDWNWTTDWPLLLLLVFALFWGFAFPRLWARTDYVKKWHKLQDRQIELMEQQLEVLRQLTELLKKLTGRS